MSIRVCSRAVLLTATLLILSSVCYSSETRHPHVFLTSADIARIRRQLLETPWSQAWRGLTKTIELYKNASHTVPSYTGDNIKELNHYAWGKEIGSHSPMRKARNLALFYAINPTQKNVWAAEEARRILLVLCSKTITGKEAYTQPLPLSSETGANTSGRGLHLTLFVINAVFVADLLYANYRMTENEKSRFSDWFRRIGALIADSHQYWDRSKYFNQPFNNHLSYHNLGLFVLGIFLGDQHWIQYSLESDENPRDFKEMVAGAIYNGKEKALVGRFSEPPLPGEIFDIYRGKKNFDYAIFHLGALSLIAHVAKNNNIDLFHYTAPGGERLDLPMRYYGKYLAKYHCGEKINGRYALPHWKTYKGRNLKPHYWLFMEILFAAYIDDPGVASLARAVYDNDCSLKRDTVLPILYLVNRKREH